MHPQGKPQTSSGRLLRRQDLLNFINTLYAGDLHAKRVLSLANATLGVLTSASLAIHAVGRGLAQAMGTLTKHGVKQVDRLLSNRGIDVWAFFAHWTPYLIGARTEVVVALDWTSFASDEQETIVLSMLTGHGRATPLLWKTVASSTLKDNQRRYEYEVLCRLREVLPDGVKVTIVADRGFADCKLFYALKTELGFEYVIRLRGDVYVTSAGGERRVAAAWVGAGGRARRLVGARVTDVHEWPVGAVVCVHDRKMDEPWCLVASEAAVPTRALIRYYGKRWGIEAGFRDIKDMRFGMGLSSMHVSRPDRRDRLLLLSALAIAVLSLLGAAGERIRTPYLYPDGDNIDLFCRVDGDTLTVSDLAETTGWLRMQSAALRRSPKQTRLIEDACVTHGIEFYHGMLQARCRPGDELAQVVTRVAQAALRVSDLWFTFRSQAVESIVDEVADFLTERELGFNRAEKLVGRSGRGWTVDFHVRTERRSSLVEVLSTSNRAAAHRVSEHVLAAWHDLNHLAAGPEALTFVSLFDDTADVWADEDFRLVEPLSTVSRWSRPDEFAAVLSDAA